MQYEVVHLPYKTSLHSLPWWTPRFVQYNYVSILSVESHFDFSGRNQVKLQILKKYMRFTLKMPEHLKYRDLENLRQNQYNCWHTLALRAVFFCSEPMIPDAGQVQSTLSYFWNYFTIDTKVYLCYINSLEILLILICFFSFNFFYIVKNLTLSTKSLNLYKSINFTFIIKYWKRFIRLLSN